MDVEEFMGDDAYDVSEVTSDQSESLNTIEKEQRYIAKLYKRNDKDYYSYKDIVNGEKKLFEFYSTQVCKNAYIRHASSGKTCPHRAGSSEEEMYFRVVDTTVVPNYEYGNRKLYYYSPEDYERHTGITVPQSVKEDWLIKSLLAKKRHYRG